MKKTELLSIVIWSSLLYSSPLLFADSLPPTIQFSLPSADNQIISGTYRLTATASDPDGVQAVRFLVSGTSVNLLATRSGTTTQYYADFNTKPLLNGAYTLTLKATDLTGRTSTMNRPVFISNTLVSLPISCGYSGSQIICSSNLVDVVYRDTLANSGSRSLQEGWRYYGPFGYSLLWNSTAKAWDLAWNSTFWKTKLVTPVLSYAALYSDPYQPGMKLVWKPPQPTMIGNGIGDVSLYDLITSCGSSVDVKLYQSSAPTSAILKTVPNGVTTSTLLQATYSMTADDAIIFETYPSSGSNPTCDALRVNRFRVRLTMTNQAPKLTFIGPSIPSRVDPVNEPGFGMGKLFTVDFVVHDEDPARLSYQCTSNGTPLAAANCTVSTVSGGTRRLRFFLPQSPTTQTVRFTATDGAALSSYLTWNTKVSFCGNGSVDAGEICDISLSQSCNQSCSAWAPKPDISLDCTRYDNLPTDATNRYGPLPTTGGTRTVYDLSGPFTWQNPNPITTLPAHFGMRCVLDFNAPFTTSHHMVISGAGGRIATDIDNYNAVLVSAWGGLSIDDPIVAEIDPKIPLGSGLHRLLLEYNLYQDSTTGVRPQWFYINREVVPDRQWLGVEIHPNITVPIPTNPIPQVNYLVPSFRQSAGATNGALYQDWGTYQLPFTVYYAGAFDFPAGRYDVFGRTMGGGIKLTQFYPKGDGTWKKKKLFNLTQTNNTIPPDMYQIDSPTLTKRPLLARYEHYNTDVRAKIDMKWQPSWAPSTCGNGKIDPGEECDHNGRPDNRCDAYCQLPPGTTNPVCGDGVVQSPETCEPPNTSTCNSSCRLKNPSTSCGDNKCGFGETSSSCAIDCGYDTVGARAINDNTNYSNVTAATPRFVGNAFVPEGDSPGCGSALVVTKMDLSNDPLNPVARAQTITLDGQAPSADMEQVRCNVEGAHELGTTEPTNGYVTKYSVCVGCRSHSPSRNFLVGNYAKIYVPRGGYVSVKFIYGPSSAWYGRIVNGATYSEIAGAGAGAGSGGSSDPSNPATMQDAAIVSVNRPVVARDSDPEDPDIAEGAAAGVGDPQPSDNIGVWDRPPRFTLLPSSVWDTPVDVYNVHAIWGLTPYNEQAMGMICHVPASYNPENTDDPLLCLNLVSTNRTTLGSLVRANGSVLMQEVSNPNDAEVKLSSGSVVEGDLDGSRRVLVNPPSNLQSRLSNVNTSPPYLYAFSDAVNPDGLFFDPLAYSGNMHIHLKATQARIAQLAAPPLAMVNFPDWNTTDPAPTAKVKNKLFHCNPNASALSAACASITEWVTDITTEGHDNDPSYYIDVKDKNAPGIAWNFVAAGYGYRLKEGKIGIYPKADWGKILKEININSLKQVNFVIKVCLGRDSGKCGN